MAPLVKLQNIIFRTKDMHNSIRWEHFNLSVPISEQFMGYAPQGKGVTMLPVCHRSATSGCINNECDIGGRVNHPHNWCGEAYWNQDFWGTNSKHRYNPYGKKPFEPTQSKHYLTLHGNIIMTLIDFTWHYLIQHDTMWHCKTLCDIA